MVKINFTPRLENGDYRVEEVSDRGHIDGSIDVKPEELPELMSELCEGDDGLLVTLRTCYDLFEPKSMTFEPKEEE